MIKTIKPTIITNHNIARSNGNPSTEKKNNLTVARTKRHQITPPSTSSNTSRIIIGIRIRLRARRLKYLRIRRRFTRFRVPETPGAAIPRRIKRAARALTRDDPVISASDLQPDRTHGVEVGNAAGVAAFSGAFEGGDGHGDVVAVDEGDVVEVLVVAEGDFGECGGRGAAEAGAEEGAAAVTGGAAAVAGGVEGAAVAAPETAGPEWREV